MRAVAGLASDVWTRLTLMADYWPRCGARRR
jgi:hypothetical protein